MAPSTTGAAAFGNEVVGVEALGKGEGEGAIGCGGAEETAANGIGVRARTRKEEIEAGVVRRRLSVRERRGKRRTERGGEIAALDVIVKLPPYPSILGIHSVPALAGTRYQAVPRLSRPLDRTKLTVRICYLLG